MIGKPYYNPSKHINWQHFCSNPKAVHVIEHILDEYPNKIQWLYLSQNPEATYLLERDLDFVNIVNNHFHHIDLYN